MATLPKLPGIPSISPVTDPVVASILRPMKESLEILSGALTGDALASGNTVTSGFNSNIGTGTGTTVIVDTGVTDYTPPPMPVGFSVNAAFTNILMSWTPAAYSNHAYTEVWRAPTNALGSAALIGSTNAAVYADPVGTAKTYYYWIRFVSTADVKGPYNASTGTIGGTGLVGGVDLGPLIIDAAKIASGAIDLSGTKITGLLNELNMDQITDPTKIADKLISNTKLADLAVDAAKLANSAVTATKIANLAVGTAAIQDAAITNALIANAAVGSAQIVNAAITSAKIANLAVGNAAIQNGAITNAKIGDLAVDTAKMADLSVVTAKIADASITDAKIVNLNATKITTGTLDAGRIGANTITADKIDSTNLTIKDAYGNVILGAGTNLDYGRINAASNWLNSNVYLNANGTLSGAGGGQVSLSGLGAGPFAALSKITPSNVGTYIDSGAIGTAYIGTAAITNALIANGAISSAKIADGEVGNAKIGNYIKSNTFDGGIDANGYIYNRGSTGWAFDKYGNAVINSLTVTSGQVTGVFQQILPIPNFYSGLTVGIYGNNPQQSLDSLYKWGTGYWYRVWTGTVPSPGVSSGAKIAGIASVSITTGTGSSRDLQVMLVVNPSYTTNYELINYDGQYHAVQVISGGDGVANVGSSGPYSLNGTAAGSSAYTFYDATPVAVFISGNQLGGTVGGVSGMFWNVR